MRLTTAFSALAVALTVVNADIVVFNQPDCGGGGGPENSPCDDSCNQFDIQGDTYSSFRVGEIFHS